MDNRESAAIVPARELQATQQEAIPEPITVSQVRAALEEAIATLEAEERFLLSAWYLDQRTLLDISRIINLRGLPPDRGRQFASGFSIESTTKWATGPRASCSFKPSCCSAAVIISGSANALFKPWPAE